MERPEREPLGPGRITFRLDDRVIAAREGDSVAAALVREGGALFTAFCLMGACQSCLVWLGERQIEACRLRVRANLEVRSTR